MGNIPENQSYYGILLEIAKAQKQLLAYRMDWESRTPVNIAAIRRSGLFGLRKEQMVEAYEKQSMLSRLEELQEKAWQKCGKRRSSGDAFWWSQPWEKVEKYLLFDLLETQRDGNWCFEYNWDVRAKDGTYLLLCHEEGHCSSFNGKYDLNFYETSHYSQAERDEMIRRHKKEMNRQDANMAIAYSGSIVQSEMTGSVYGSISDYLLSAEHYMVREYYKEEFKGGLFTQHQQNILRAISDSIHYCSVYAVADYHINSDGLLEEWNSRAYELVDNRGNLPNELVERRQNKEAAVACAAYIAGQAEVVAVPLSIFGKFFSDSVEDLDQCLMYAEIFTCLAEKLRVIELHRTEPPQTESGRKIVAGNSPKLKVVQEDKSQTLREWKSEILSLLGQFAGETPQFKLITRWAQGKPVGMECWLGMAEDILRINLDYVLMLSLGCIWLGIAEFLDADSVLTLPFACDETTQNTVNSYMELKGKGGDLVSMLQMLEMLAEGGCTEAMWQLSALYKQLEGERNMEGWRWHEAASKAHHPIADNHIMGMLLWALSGNVEALNRLEEIFYALFEITYDTNSRKYVFDENILHDDILRDNNIYFKEYWIYRGIWRCIWMADVGVNEVLASDGNILAVDRLQKYLFVRIDFKTGKTFK